MKLQSKLTFSEKENFYLTFLTISCHWCSILYIIVNYKESYNNMLLLDIDLRSGNTNGLQS